MRTKILKMAAAVAATVSLGASVQALPFISGDIDMNNGIATLDNTVLNSATTVTAISGTMVDAGDTTGDYAGTVGTAVAFTTPIVFNPSNGNTPINNLWSFTIGATTYSFDLKSVGKAPDSTASFLDLTGTGIAHITGFNDTPGTWTFTISNSKGKSAGAKFGFQSTTSVPEGGATLMLLGGALSGLGLLRRKFAA